MEHRAQKNVNCCWNTKLSFTLRYLFVGQNFNTYLNVVHFFNISVNKISMSAKDSFLAQVSNTCCSVMKVGVKCIAMRNTLGKHKY